MSRAFGVSLAMHVAMVVAVFVMQRPAARSSSPPATNVGVNPQLVFRNDQGSGGGGGGGGNLRAEPPQKLKLVGRDAISVSVAAPRRIESRSEAPPDRERIVAPNIPVVSLASADGLLPGSVLAPPAPPTSSRGPGSGDGVGPGLGSGDGPGRGNGLGKGTDEGMDGGAYRPGSDVSMPIEIRRGTPQYTTDAVRARAQGSIMVECVVQPDGACSNIHVKRSFEPTFGLDREAIKAAAQWRFRPGMRRGQPVPVLVTIEITFTLR